MGEKNIYFKNLYEPNFEMQMCHWDLAGGLWRARPPTGGLLVWLRVLQQPLLLLLLRAHFLKDADTHRHHTRVTTIIQGHQP